MEEQTENRTDLFTALAQAQASFEPIVTDSKVEFPTKSGQKVKYNYASFAAIVIIFPSLGNSFDIAPHLFNFDAFLYSNALPIKIFLYFITEIISNVTHFFIKLSKIRFL